MYTSIASLSSGAGTSKSSEAEQFRTNGFDAQQYRDTYPMKVCLRSRDAFRNSVSMFVWWVLQQSASLRPRHFSRVIRIIMRDCVLSLVRAINLPSVQRT